jgi:hypothetical protein
MAPFTWSVTDRESGMRLTLPYPPAESESNEGKR